MRVLLVVPVGVTMIIMMMIAMTDRFPWPC
jgi:hypothetical protein